MERKRVMNKPLVLYVILFTSLFLTSCIGTNEEFDKIRDKVFENIGDKYNAEVQFSIGSVGLTLSSWIVDISEDENMPSDIMDDVSSIQIGVYEKVRDSCVHKISVLYEIEDVMQKSGWKSIVKSSSGDELSAIYLRIDSEELLSRLFIINFDGNEIVLAEVEGDLQEAIAEIIKDKGIKINI